MVTWRAGLAECAQACPRSAATCARVAGDCGQPVQPGMAGSQLSGALRITVVALPRLDAVNERTCRRAIVAYGLLMLQKQYSSMPPEPSPGGRKCSLSTMWL